MKEKHKLAWFLLSLFNLSLIFTVTLSIALSYTIWINLNEQLGSTWEPANLPIYRFSEKPTYYCILLLAMFMSYFCILGTIYLDVQVARHGITVLENASAMKK